LYTTAWVSNVLVQVWFAVSCSHVVCSLQTGMNCIHSWLTVMYLFMISLNMQIR